MSKIDTKLKYFIINLLRKGTFSWKPRGEAKKKYKVKVGEYSTGRAKYQYKCIDCRGIFKSGEVKMDHIHPVVDPIKGFTGFDEYIQRMYCDEDGFCCLCEECHANKTSVEREYRNNAKKLIKENKQLDDLNDEYRLFLEKYKKSLDN